MRICGEMMVVQKRIAVVAHDHKKKELLEWRSSIPLAAQQYDHAVPDYANQRRKGP